MSRERERFPSELPGLHHLACKLVRIALPADGAKLACKLVRIALPADRAKVKGELCADHSSKLPPRGLGLPCGSSPKRRGSGLTCAQTTDQ